MLTADLLRVKKKNGVITPRWVDASSDGALEKAGTLIDAFESGRDGPRGEIDARVESLIGFGTDFLVWRGLAKLLYDRSEFETVAPADPVDIRRAVFERSAHNAPRNEEERLAILHAAAIELDIEPRDVDASLYADLEDRQLLVEFEAPTPSELLNRYNLALAQAVLYRATSMTIKLDEKSPNKLRYLFQALKFNRLMHRISSTADGYELYVDGPLSLFGKSRKYGLNLATFLPALVLARAWRMEAEIEWEKGRSFTFSLSPEDALVSHYKARGQWIAEEERYFEKRFDETVEGWSLRREGKVHELNRGEVLVTDYVVVDPDGREAFVEIVGFWRKSYIERRLELLGELDVPAVLVVSERLRSDRGKFDHASAQLVFFKGVILADKVVEAAQNAIESHSAGDRD